MDLKEKKDQLDAAERQKREAASSLDAIRKLPVARRSAKQEAEAEAHGQMAMRRAEASEARVAELTKQLKSLQQDLQTAQHQLIKECMVQVGRPCRLGRRADSDTIAACAVPGPAAGVP